MIDLRETARNEISEVGGAAVAPGKGPSAGAAGAPGAAGLTLDGQPTAKSPDGTVASGIEGDRMQVVDQQQGRDQRIVGEAGRDPRALGSGPEERVDDPLQAIAVELEDRRHELIGQIARGRLLTTVQQRLQLLNALEQHPRLVSHHRRLHDGLL